MHRWLTHPPNGAAATRPAPIPQLLNRQPQQGHSPPALDKGTEPRPQRRLHVRRHGSSRVVRLAAFLRQYKCTIQTCTCKPRPKEGGRHVTSQHRLCRHTSSSAARVAATAVSNVAADALSAFAVCGSSYVSNRPHPVNGLGPAGARLRHARLRHAGRIGCSETLAAIAALG